jgi:hypothetical protein
LVDCRFDRWAECGARHHSTLNTTFGKLRGIAASDIIRSACGTRERA